MKNNAQLKERELRLLVLFLLIILGMRSSTTLECAACVCILKKLWVSEKICSKFVKPWEIKKLTWDREKSSETLWHTVKPWELRSLVLLFFLQRIVYGHQWEMCSVQVFCKKVLLKISTIFTGTYLRWSLFLMKLQGLQTDEKRFQHRCFPVNIVEFSRTTFL